MLYRFDIHLQSDVRPSVHWGSLMHGILNGILPPPWPDFLHTDTDRCLCQFVEPLDARTAVWHICVTDDGLASAIANVLSQSDTLYCRHFSGELRITGRNGLQTGIKELFDRASSCRSAAVRLQAVSPVSHKSHGVFITLPSIECIVNSIIRKASAFLPECALPVEDELTRMLSACRVGKYDLHSVTYQLEGHYVPSWQGHLQIVLPADEYLHSLACAVFQLAEYTGIGIKTSLGMGGCKVEFQ